MTPAAGGALLVLGASAVAVVAGAARLPPQHRRLALALLAAACVLAAWMAVGSAPAPLATAEGHDAYGREWAAWLARVSGHLAALALTIRAAAAHSTVHSRSIPRPPR